MATKTITIEVEECPVNGCDEAGESALEPHFCRKHAEAFYGSAEGEAARYEREKQQAEFIARLNGTHTRSCMNCDRWGTTDDIMMAGPEGGEEPFCCDRDACARRAVRNRYLSAAKARVSA